MNNIFSLPFRSLSMIALARIWINTPPVSIGLPDSSLPENESTRGKVGSREMGHQSSDGDLRISMSANETINCFHQIMWRILVAIPTAIPRRSFDDGGLEIWMGSTKGSTKDSS